MELEGELEGEQRMEEKRKGEGRGRIKKEGREGMLPLIFPIL